MNSFDDFSDDIDDEALLNAAIKAENNLQLTNGAANGFEDTRLAKRRKVGHEKTQKVILGPSEDQICLVSDEISDDELCGAFGDVVTAEKATEEDEYDDFDDNFAGVSFDQFPPTPKDHSNWQHLRARAPLNGLVQTTLFGRTIENEWTASQVASKRLNYREAIKNEPPTHHALDLEAAKIWVYPTNPGPVRQYQLNIVKKGLFSNTLVALPTGLGKTFIAATIMLNWYRWTKDAQIIFVAPTKPLVTQQIHACFHTVGIPYTDAVVLTGEVNKRLREEQWKSKRVFFMTPQTLQEDLSKGIADPKKIVLLVVDEAHRAKGNYAFVKVVEFIQRFNQGFRVLALTATPGGDIPAVQEVIDRLNIAQVEIRTDHSMDIRQYVHDRQVDKEVFKNTVEMVEIMEYYSESVKPLLNEIQGQNLFWSNDPLTLTPFGCTQALRKWMGGTEAGRADRFLKGRVASVLSTLGKVSHGMDLLKYHGIHAAYNAWKKMRSEYEVKNNFGGKYSSMLLKSPAFQKMMNQLEIWTNDQDFVGHPKMAYLRDVIMNHLLDNPTSSISGSGTRIMVFSTFRDSAEEISKVLERTNPMIKPHVFVGQADSKGGSKGMNQKQQLEVIEKFKKGEFNVLIATSIGEEGLDIGEVDLIVCYDSKASPLRMLQRMGRTGRKRAGRVVLLQMEGKEVNDWLKAKDSYSSMQELIAEGTMFNFHRESSRRILPSDIDPEMDQRFIDIPVENTQISPDQLSPRLEKKNTRRKASGPKTKKKFNMPDDVETGFVTAGCLTKTAPKKSTRAKTNSNKTSTKPLAEDEIEPIPFLDNVTLSAAQTKELERKYQYMHFGEDEDAYISGPSMDKFPEMQRTFTGTGFVKHGRATISFVNAMKTINQIHHTLENPNAEVLDIIGNVENVLQSDEDGKSEEEDDELPELSTLLHKGTTKRFNGPKRSASIRSRPLQTLGKKHSRQNVGEAEEGSSSSPAASDPAYAIGNAGIWLGSEDTAPPSSRLLNADEEEDDDLDGFIVGDDEHVTEDDSDDSLASPAKVRLRTGTKSIDVIDLDGTSASDSDENELPDMLELVTEKKSQISAAPKGGNKRRFVLESDEEES